MYHDLKLLWFKNAYDCLFAYLPAYLFLKQFNKCEHVIVGVVLPEHGKKCDIAIFRHCHTLSVISVNETVETESCIIVKYIELYDFIFYWTLPQSYQFLL